SRPLPADVIEMLAKAEPTARAGFLSELAAVVALHGEREAIRSLVAWIEKKPDDLGDAGAIFVGLSRGARGAGRGLSDIVEPRELDRAISLAVAVAGGDAPASERVAAIRLLGL